MITIDKITMAIGKMDEMLKCYSSLFDIEFEPLELFGSTLYTGKIGNVELLFCPKSIAGVDANTNTVQLRLVVQDVKETLRRGLENGATVITDIQKIEGGLNASLRDPDNNSVELIQKGA